MLRTLSGRFLILTIIFVMVAEILIFVPSIARYREDYLLLRLERAQIASLALLADDMIDVELEQELLKNTSLLAQCSCKTERAEEEEIVICPVHNLSESNREPTPTNQLQKYPTLYTHPQPTLQNLF